jgi:hypothetical protein
MNSRVSKIILYNNRVVLFVPVEHVVQFVSNCFVGVQKYKSFLGAFAKLRKATNSFVMSVHPSVRMEQLGSH